MALQEVVVQTVTGLGYDLVELERSAGGLLRITIDHPWTMGSETVFVTVEDCEKVTRQLQFVLEAEEVEYRRLEVSSPGIDRPLRHQADFERFAGEVIDITLKAPMGAAAGGQVSALRKNSEARWRKARPPDIGKLFGAMRCPPSPVSGSVTKGQPRHRRCWGLHWKSCARHALRLWLISRAVWPVQFEHERSQRS